jgi:hypothetical protein
MKWRKCVVKFTLADSAMHRVSRQGAVNLKVLRRVLANVRAAKRRQLAAELYFELVRSEQPAQALMLTDMRYHQKCALALKESLGALYEELRDWVARPLPPGLAALPAARAHDLGLPAPVPTVILGAPVPGWRALPLRP